MKIRGIKTAKIGFQEMSLEEFLDKYILAEELEEGSVVAITSKVVSLCEGRGVKVGAAEKEKLVIAEAERYLSKEENKYEVMMTIKNNILIPWAGIDESNTGGYYVMWPEDAQASANRAREFLAKKTGLKRLGVIITDSKTTPLRWGVTGIGLAGSGFLGLNDIRGQEDLDGRKMAVTTVNVLDALAAAAVFEMGEAAEGKPLVVLSDFEEGQVEFTGRNPSKEELKMMEIDAESDVFGRILESVNWKQGGGGMKIKEEKRGENE